MSRFFSSDYAALTPYTPGEQPRIANLIKLNTNESPFPPSPKAQEYAKKAAENVQLYSDPTAKKLHEALAANLGVGNDLVSSSISGAKGAVEGTDLKIQLGRLRYGEPVFLVEENGLIGFANAAPGIGIKSLDLPYAAFFQHLF